ncbi:MAG: response regulator transcription factor [Cyclobacteriaceae bacterium]|jgi:two-component system, LytTR family, response regulator|nr:response regulator transcription factor [Cyclobacteriaceae bacterium]
MSNPGFKVLIVEDETPAAEKLERYLHRYNEAIEVKGKVESVEEAVRWLEVHQSTIDLIFMDIQLKDGVSFEIFKEVKVEKPVIFITAYNEYALDAFKMNGIDYLLKPITFTDLSTSLQKVETLGSQLRWSDDRSETISKTFDAAIGKSYKNRFMVKLGDHIKSITSDQISIFFADGRDVYLITDQMRKFIIDYTLESLDEILDPKIFYRVNRSYIVNISAIQDVVVFSNSRLKISPHVKWEPQIIVSREKVGAFKEWFDGTH